MRRTEPLPRYSEIRQALERAILSGEWPPGHRIPVEHELAAQYDCSRMTVNKALSALADSGLIVRRRRSGSFVAPPGSPIAAFEIQDIEAETRRSGQSYRFDLSFRSERKATKIDCERLGVVPGNPVLALKGRHFAADRPLLVEDRLINVAAVPAARSAQFVHKAPGSWLLAEVPWSQAEHHIKAVNAPSDVAAALGLAQNAACLVVERKTWQQGKPVTHVVLYYPGNQHQLVAYFDPTSAAIRPRRSRAAKLQLS